MSEKSNPFKGFPSLFSRSSKKQDEPSTSGSDDRQLEENAPRLNADSRQLVADSKFFDATWYLRQNPDVAAAQIAPLEHYLSCGEKEGRNPGPDFDVGWYVKKYPEFAVTGLGALEHYLRYGHLENKSTNLVDYRKRLENDPHLAEECSALKTAPLKCYTSPPLTRRVNLVIDSMSLRKFSDKSNEARENPEVSIERGLQIAIMLAVATGSSLRVVTRVTGAQVSGFRTFMLEKSLQAPAHVEFVHCDYANAQPALSISRWDLFITLDALSHASVRSSINEKNIFDLAATHKFLSAADDDLSSIVGELARSCKSVFV